MRVTIGQLTEDLTPFTKQGDEAMNIEIVPRKMVEMIIDYARSETHGVAEFAEILLKNFEEGVTDGSHNE